MPFQKIKTPAGLTISPQELRNKAEIRQGYFYFCQLVDNLPIELDDPKKIGQCLNALFIDIYGVYPIIAKNL